MTPTGGTISVTVGKLPCKIHVTKADGTTPVAFNDAGLTSRLTLPVDEVGADKVVYLTADGTYTVKIWVDKVLIYTTSASVTGGSDTIISLPAHVS